MATGDVKLVYGAEQTMTVTSLHSLASSATTCWASDIVDNTVDLFEDAIVQVVAAFSNVAPDSNTNKCIHVFAYGGINATYSNPLSGSEGQFTIPSIVSNPQCFWQIGVIPYNVQNEVAESQPLYVSPAFGGLLAPKWGIALVDYSGAALASSGNSVKWRGVYRNVA